MALWNNFPYSNVHELNLDWIIEEMQRIIKAMEDYAGQVSASAYQSLTPQVTVNGDLITGLQFDFGLPAGAQGPAGPAGPEGPEGPEGPAGEGLQILDTYPTLAALQAAHPTGNPGDAYLVGTAPNFIMYIWSTGTSAWVNAGPLTAPSPSSSNPLMDGTASTGSSNEYARGDHRHPSDTSKQNTLVSGTNIKTVNSESLLGSGDVAVQETLVSGTNIKTVNSNSLLGAGDVAVQETLISGTNIKTINSNSLLGSGNIALQTPLVSGTDIKTINNESLLGSGDVSVQPTLVSGTNIKTVNSNSLLGAGDISISGSAPG
ncbi:MAG: hypothetical protein IKG01_08255, partial [Lachnospiraceae bacterium]|nr:hypothetical protein [Lachnospiraceae bacterium]